MKVSATRKKIGRAQDIFTENVRARMEDRYRSLPTLSAKIFALSDESGVGKSTIQRIIDPITYERHRTTIDVAEKLAKAFRCETYELLVDPKSPRGTPEP